MVAFSFLTDANHARSGDQVTNSYQLESLGDDRFQQLCQALMVAEAPNAQCLPVGQPDGGRDGFSKGRSTEAENQAIYQVKFVKDPNSRESRDLVEQVIQTERQKVARLISKGATSYHLMTNVRGTSHLDVGSIDKVNAALSAAFSIPAYCWWRDDLERRIDASHAIKWSFPEILRATDLLETLLQSTVDPDARRQSDAIRSYMTHQAGLDAQLKFKQIDLQKNIIDLFVDVPATVAAAPDVDIRQHHAEWTRVFDQLDIEPVSDRDDPDLGNGGLAVGALELLIKQGFIEGCPRVVIEGAPGQGKSTVTQYLCQVNRLRLLNRVEYSRVAEKHRPTEARIPFRVDLRDYASWLSGRDPFGDGLTGTPAGSTPILESFIAAQVHRSTGASFTVDDLTAVATRSQLVIVLDGFDEVAEITLRNRIVDEVSQASARIAVNALSSQIIVTSRPAVFANSPGFPRNDWQYVEIRPLARSVIELYADKWLRGRGADARERANVTAVLKDKLTQGHVRDLARNPMQLAILLALISVQGASLPDKRTELYDNYIDIFLNRESEKSQVIRDHRALLVQIHR